MRVVTGSQPGTSADFFQQRLISLPGVRVDIDNNYTIGYTIIQIGGMTYGNYKDCNIY